MSAMDRLTLPKRVKNVEDNFNPSIRQSAVPAGDSLPVWGNLPLDAKLPMVPNPKGSVVLYTTDLGDLKHKSSRWHDFDLVDPYVYQTETAYRPLHDPHLKGHFMSPNMRNLLIEKGFITKSGKVTCTLREFNEYRQYLRKICLLELKREQRKKEDRKAAALRRRQSEHRPPVQIGSDGYMLPQTHSEHVRHRLQTQDQCEREKMKLILLMEDKRMERIRRERTQKEADREKRILTRDKRRRDVLIRQQEKEERHSMMLLRKWINADKMRVQLIERRQEENILAKQTKLVERWEERKQLQKQRFENEVAQWHRIEKQKRENIEEREKQIQKRREREEAIFTRHLEKAERERKEQEARVSRHLSMKLASGDFRIWSSRGQHSRYQQRRTPFKSLWLLEEVLRKLSIPDLRLITRDSSKEKLLEMLTDAIDEAVDLVTSARSSLESDVCSGEMSTSAEQVVKDAISKVTQEVYPQYLRYLDASSSDNLCDTDELTPDDQRERMVTFSHMNQVIPEPEYQGYGNLDVSDTSFRPVSQHRLTPIPSLTKATGAQEQLSKNQLQEADVNQASPQIDEKQVVVQALHRLLDDVSNGRLSRDELLTLANYSMDIIMRYDATCRQLGEEMLETDSQSSTDESLSSVSSSVIADEVVQTTLRAILDDIQSGKISEEDLTKLTMSLIGIEQDGDRSPDLVAAAYKDSMAFLDGIDIDDFISITLQKIFDDLKNNKLSTDDLKKLASSISNSLTLIDPDVHALDYDAVRDKLHEVVCDLKDNNYSDEDVQRIVSSIVSSYHSLYSSSASNQHSVTDVISSVLKSVTSNYASGAFSDEDMAEIADRIMTSKSEARAVLESVQTKVHILFSYISNVLKAFQHCSFSEPHLLEMSRHIIAAGEEVLVFANSTVDEQESLSQSSSSLLADDFIGSFLSGLAVALSEEQLNKSQLADMAVIVLNACSFYIQMPKCAFDHLADSFVYSPEAVQLLETVAHDISHERAPPDTVANIVLSIAKAVAPLSPEYEQLHKLDSFTANVHDYVEAVLHEALKKLHSKESSNIASCVSNAILATKKSIHSVVSIQVSELNVSVSKSLSNLAGQVIMETLENIKSMPSRPPVPDQTSPYNVSDKSYVEMVTSNLQDMDCSQLQELVKETLSQVLNDEEKSDSRSSVSPSSYNSAEKHLSEEKLSSDSKLDGKLSRAVLSIVTNTLQRIIQGMDNGEVQSEEQVVALAELANEAYIATAAYQHVEPGDTQRQVCPGKTQSVLQAIASVYSSSYGDIFGVGIDALIEEDVNSLVSRMLNKLLSDIADRKIEIDNVQSLHTTLQTWWKETKHLTSADSSKDDTGTSTIASKTVRSLIDKMKSLSGEDISKKSSVMDIAEELVHAAVENVIGARSATSKLAEDLVRSAVRAVICDHSVSTSAITDRLMDSVAEDLKSGIAAQSCCSAATIEAAEDVVKAVLSKIKNDLINQRQILSFESTEDESFERTTKVLSNKLIQTIMVEIQRQDVASQTSLSSDASDLATQAVNALIDAIKADIGRQIEQTRDGSDHLSNSSKQTDSSDGLRHLKFSLRRVIEDVTESRLDGKQLEMIASACAHEARRVFTEDIKTTPLSPKDLSEDHSDKPVSEGSSSVSTAASRVVIQTLNLILHDIESGRMSSDEIDFINDQVAHSEEAYQLVEEGVAETHISQADNIPDAKTSLQQINTLAKEIAQRISSQMTSQTAGEQLEKSSGKSDTISTSYAASCAVSSTIRRVHFEDESRYSAVTMSYLAHQIITSAIGLADEVQRISASSSESGVSQTESVKPAVVSEKEMMWKMGERDEQVQYLSKQQRDAMWQPDDTTIDIEVATSAVDFVRTLESLKAGSTLPSTSVSKATNTDFDIKSDIANSSSAASAATAQALDIVGTLHSNSSYAGSTASTVFGVLRELDFINTASLLSTSSSKHVAEVTTGYITALRKIRKDAVSTSNLILPVLTATHGFLQELVKVQAESDISEVFTLNGSTERHSEQSDTISSSEAASDVVGDILHGLDIETIHAEPMYEATASKLLDVAVTYMNRLTSVKNALQTLDTTSETVLPKQVASEATSISKSDAVSGSESTSGVASAVVVETLKRVQEYQIMSDTCITIPAASQVVTATLNLIEEVDKINANQASTSEKTGANSSNEASDKGDLHCYSSKDRAAIVLNATLSILENLEECEPVAIALSGTEGRKELSKRSHSKTKKSKHKENGDINNSAFSSLFSKKEKSKESKKKSKSDSADNVQRKTSDENSSVESNKGSDQNQHIPPDKVIGLLTAKSAFLDDLERISYGDKSAPGAASDVLFATLRFLEHIQNVNPKCISVSNDALDILSATHGFLKVIESVEQKAESKLKSMSSKRLSNTTSESSNSKSMLTSTSATPSGTIVSARENLDDRACSSEITSRIPVADAEELSTTMGQTASTQDQRVSPHVDIICQPSEPDIPICPARSRSLSHSMASEMVGDAIVHALECMEHTISLQAETNEVHTEPSIVQENTTKHDTVTISWSDTKASSTSSSVIEKRDSMTGDQAGSDTMSTSHAASEAVGNVIEDMNIEPDDRHIAEKMVTGVVNATVNYINELSDVKAERLEKTRSKEKSSVTDEGSSTQSSESKAKSATTSSAASEIVQTVLETVIDSVAAYKVLTATVDLIGNIDKMQSNEDAAFGDTSSNVGTQDPSQPASRKSSREGASLVLNATIGKLQQDTAAKSVPSIGSSQDAGMVVSCKSRSSESTGKSVMSQSSIHSIAAENKIIATTKSRSTEIAKKKSSSIRLGTEAIATGKSHSVESVQKSSSIHSAPHNDEIVASKSRSTESMSKSVRRSSSIRSIPSHTISVSDGNSEMVEGIAMVLSATSMFLKALESITYDENIAPKATSDVLTATQVFLKNIGNAQPGNVVPSAAIDVLDATLEYLDNIDITPINSSTDMNRKDGAQVFEADESIVKEVSSKSAQSVEHALLQDETKLETLSTTDVAHSAIEKPQSDEQDISALRTASKVASVTQNYVDQLDSLKTDFVQSEEHVQPKSLSSPSNSSHDDSVPSIEKATSNIATDVISATLDLIDEIDQIETDDGSISKVASLAVCETLESIRNQPDLERKHSSTKEAVHVLSATLSFIDNKSSMMSLTKNKKSSSGASSATTLQASSKSSKIASSNKNEDQIRMNSNSKINSSTEMPSNKCASSSVESVELKAEDATDILKTTSGFLHCLQMIPYTDISAPKAAFSVLLETKQFLHNLDTNVSSINVSNAALAALNSTLEYMGRIIESNIATQQAASVKQKLESVQVDDEVNVSTAHIEKKTSVEEISGVLKAICSSYSGKSMPSSPVPARASSTLSREGSEDVLTRPSSQLSCIIRSTLDRVLADIKAMQIPAESLTQIASSINGTASDQYHQERVRSWVADAQILSRESQLIESIATESIRQTLNNIKGGVVNEKDMKDLARALSKRVGLKIKENLSLSKRDSGGNLQSLLLSDEPGHIYEFVSNSLENVIEDLKKEGLPSMSSKNLMQFLLTKKLEESRKGHDDSGSSTQIGQLAYDVLSQVATSLDDMKQDTVPKDISINKVSADAEDSEVLQDTTESDNKISHVIADTQGTSPILPCQTSDASVTGNINMVRQGKRDSGYENETNTESADVFWPDSTGSMHSGQDKFEHAESGIRDNISENPKSADLSFQPASPVKRVSNADAGGQSESSSPSVRCMFGRADSDSSDIYAPQYSANIASSSSIKDDNRQIAQKSTSTDAAPKLNIESGTEISSPDKMETTCTEVEDIVESESESSHNLFRRPDSGGLSEYFLADTQGVTEAKNGDETKCNTSNDSAPPSAVLGSTEKEDTYHDVQLVVLADDYEDLSESSSEDLIQPMLGQTPLHLQAGTISGALSSISIRTDAHGHAHGQHGPTNILNPHLPIARNSFVNLKRPDLSTIRMFHHDDVVQIEDKITNASKRHLAITHGHIVSVDEPLGEEMASSSSSSDDRSSCCYTTSTTDLDDEQLQGVTNSESLSSQRIPSKSSTRSRRSSKKLKGRIKEEPVENNNNAILEYNNNRNSFNPTSHTPSQSKRCPVTRSIIRDILTMSDKLSNANRICKGLVVSVNKERQMKTGEKNDYLCERASQFHSLLDSPNHIPERNVTINPSPPIKNSIRIDKKPGRLRPLVKESKQTRFTRAEPTLQISSTSSAKSHENRASFRTNIEIPTSTKDSSGQIKSLCGSHTSAITLRKSEN